MRLWIAMTLGAVALAAGTWWLTRSAEPEATPAKDVAQVMVNDFHSPPRYIPPVPTYSPRLRRIEGVEPIAVVPESDPVVEPIPSPMPPTTVAREVPDRLVPRPETGIEPVPWMPYAEEEAELARLRREAAERLAEQQTEEPPLFRRIRELTETAEPPLTMPDRSSWRSRGKLPCSVK